MTRIASARPRDQDDETIRHDQNGSDIATISPLRTM